ncbi:MAG TPA: ATP-binding cassette domain-containing protein [Solirubrobacteraceae bacterium]|jgi:ABC-type sugar transport system ATPase subunit|nr:ATP-binding cassette domain-containing protein [Solirubrobacteraceae bacterium]
MSLLSLQGVNKRYTDGPRERVVLRDASLDVEAGELVVVWGLRRSGRSTLLRVASGIEAPDSGLVLFDGRDLAEDGEDVLGGGIGYCRKTLRSNEGATALDEIMVGLLARGVAPAAARSRARSALERTGAEHCDGARLGHLDSAEAVRVALARTLALRPRLLVIDEPVNGIDLMERDGILLLLRSLADQGMAVLASAGEPTALTGADRAVSLGAGELRAGPQPELAPVVALRRSPARRQISG